MSSTRSGHKNYLAGSIPAEEKGGMSGGLLEETWDVFRRHFDALHLMGRKLYT